MTDIAELINSHAALLCAALLMAGLETSYRFARQRHWRKSEEFLAHIRATGYSIALGVLAGVGSEKIGLSTAFGFKGTDDVVASVVAGSLTTGITLYVSMFLVQVPAMRRDIEKTLENRLYGVDGLDIQKAMVRGVLDEIPRFDVASTEFPIYLANPLASERNRDVSDGAKGLRHVALGMVVDRACGGNDITKAYTALIEKMPGLFTHVLLLETRNNRYSSIGVASVSAFSNLLDPRGKEPEESIAVFIAERVSEFSKQNQKGGDPHAASLNFFENRGFVTGKVAEESNLRHTIESVVHLKRNRAIVTLQNGAEGIADLWKLLRFAYSIDS